MTAIPCLTGVGVGPGDPDLVTVKAVKVLGDADHVFVPVAASGVTGYAEQVVAAHLDPARIRRLVFTLGDDPATRERDWAAAADTVTEAIAGGAHAAFATIGDPNLYSTFTYLAAGVRDRLPTVSVETVPGITALQDLAARSGTVLAEATQTLALLPLSAGDQRLRTALADHDTVVVYKGGRHLPRVREVIAAAGRLDEAVFGARLGLDGQQVGEPPDAQAPYLSTVIIRRQAR